MQKKFTVFAIVLIFLGLFSYPMLSNAVAKTSTVDFGVLAWMESKAVGSLITHVLETEMGLSVNRVNPDLRSGLEAVKEKDLDLLIEIWLPLTHDTYWEEYSSYVHDFGAIYENAKLCWAIPDYIPEDVVSSVTDFSKEKVKDKMGRKIYGISPASGLMQASQVMMEEYTALQDWQLVEGSGSEMQAKLNEKITNKEWTAVTIWQPHSAFAEFGIRCIEEPKNILGGEEKIHMVGRKDFTSVYKKQVNLFLENFSLPIEKVNELTNLYRKEGDEAGEIFAEKYPELLKIPVEFPDEDLEQIIRQKIDKPTRTIYKSDLEEINSLEAINEGIQDLTGIGSCVNLRTLSLDGNKISNPEKLSELKGLENLGLSDTGVSNIDFLSDLTNLISLRLAHNGISNIDSLSEVTALKFLDLVANNVSGIEPLSNLTNLEILYLSNNNLTDISPLANLTNLKLVVLDSNEISDISPLSNLTSLQGLESDNNQIDSLEPLSNLSELRAILLANNKIESLAPLSNLTKLGDPLVGLKQLPSDVPHLYLPGNEISDVSPLVENSEIDDGDRVDVRYNRLDIREGSDVRKDLEALIDRGVDLRYEPQSCLSIPYVVSHWDTENNKLDPDDDSTISFAEILNAIAWWADDTEVPATCGKTIGFSTVLDLIKFWANSAPIDKGT